MDFYDVIRDRESIRNYDPDRPVDRAVLERILEAGRMAPSAANVQPWRFLLISSPKMLEKIRPCYQRSWFHEAPHVLVAVGNHKEAWVRETDGIDYLQTDLAIAMDHIVLAAENEGVATCWIAAFKLAVLKDILELKAEETVYTITPLGYPKAGFRKRGKKERKGFDRVVEFL
jgi:nitroreductase